MVIVTYICHVGLPTYTMVNLAMRLPVGDGDSVDVVMEVLRRLPLNSFYEIGGRLVSRLGLSGIRNELHVSRIPPQCLSIQFASPDGAALRRGPRLRCSRWCTWVSTH